VARATGVQSEMELAFAGLHQLCAPLLGRAGRLPVPQRDALWTAFGVAAGPPPDRFFVGLAVLSLLSEVAGERPLVCVIDDAQWLDQTSAQALGFAARRLAAEPVALVFAARDPGAQLAGLPELEVTGPWTCWLRPARISARLRGPTRSMPGRADATVMAPCARAARGSASRGTGRRPSGHRVVRWPGGWPARGP
jgi:hypothetical protein